MKPESISEYQEFVRHHTNILIQGGQSKPALSATLPGVEPLDMRALSGILEYEPGEYTFTAYAATAVSHIQQELAHNNQYLPFDPLLAAAGATLGGVVASNTCGSGRYRYGGVRDFILGVKFIDGHGRLIRSGGKVVKNAAGFDLPKFMVGSLGRYGALVELTFKVFPQPPDYHTLIAHYEEITAVQKAIFSLASQPLEIDALDVNFAADGRPALHLRLGGLAEALPNRLHRCQTYLKANTAVSDLDIIQNDRTLWQDANALAWSAGRSTVLKVPLTPRLLPAFDTAVARLDALRRYTVGGSIAWIALNDVQQIEPILTENGLAGLALRGKPGRAIIGERKGEALAQRVKQALDPAGTFLADTNLEAALAA